MAYEGIEVFLKDLSSGAPVPGGGGASALIGGVASALASMVANLTTGKKKYAQYQGEIDEIIPKTQELVKDFYELIAKDAEVFEPLSKAYSIPKDQPDRDQILEQELKNACTVPFETVMKAREASVIVERLEVIGSRLAISDAGVAAAALVTCAKGAAMNVYINTKMMTDRDYADDLNKRTDDAVNETASRCNEVYDKVKASLTAGR